MTDNLFTNVYTVTQDCVVCGNPFSFPKPDRGRYPVCCSDRCREKRLWQQRRYYSRLRSSRPTVICERCNKPFQRSNGRMKFCSVDCRMANKLDVRRRKGFTSGSHGYHQKRCKACDTLFWSKTDNDKFLCSEQCQIDWSRIKRPPVTFTLYRRARYQWEPVSFDSLFPVHDFRPAKVRRLRIKITSVERVSLIKVLNRDGWICQLCGKDTPKALRGSNHDDAPEVDHIVPLSKGGRHVYSNLQCACRACNRRKGANHDRHQ